MSGHRDPAGVPAQLELVSRLAKDDSLDGLRTLAAGVAHDFNNLLAVILSCAEFAELALEPKTAEAEALRDARAAALRAADLCKLILAFSGKRSALSSTVDLASALERAIETVSAPLDVVIDVLTPSVETLLSADPGLIDQLLVAILENAVAACQSGGGGRVTVALKREKGRSSPRGPRRRRRHGR